jgi:hypothetical protein
MKPLDSPPNEWSLPEKGPENTLKPLDSPPNEWSLAEKGRENTPSPSVNARGSSAEQTFTSIVVAYNGSQESERALETAVRLQE